MKKETKCVLACLCLTAGLIGATIVSPRRARAGYQMTSDSDGYATDEYDVETSTITIDAWGAFTVNENYGTITCSADSFTWAHPGTAEFDAEAWGWIEYSWQWYGPPSTPSGGTLSWRNDGDGTATADGATVPGQNGSATSYGSAGSTTSVSAYTSSVTGGAAWGLVSNNQMATGEAYGYGYPEEPHTVYPIEDPDYGEYYYGVTWNGDYQTEDEIPENTAYFSVVVGADCTCGAYSTASGTGDADTDTTADASVNASVDFTPF